MIVDDPPMLELLFEPFQMLRTTVVSMYAPAARLRKIEKTAREATTSESQWALIVHRPYGDGALVATLEALVYFALGLRVGIEWGADHVSIEPGFRSRNVVGEPPYQPAHFEVARASFEELVKELRGGRDS